MKILVAEDDEILFKVLEEKLKGEGFSVEGVGSGDKVLESVKKVSPSLVLLDLILPVKDGLTALREMKEDPEASKIPVVVLSNLGEDEEIKTALRLGAVDYLVKTQHPVDEVVDKVKAIFSGS